LRELESSPETFAYPYGDTDPAVEHLVGGCGFTIGVSTRGGLSSLADSALSLPRIEIGGTTELAEFALALSGKLEAGG
jgi:hypothetical protein